MCCIDSCSVWSHNRPWRDWSCRCRASMGGWSLGWWVCSRCIVDHGVRIPPGMVIGEDAQEDARRFRRTENGITLVTQNMIDRLA